MSSGIAEQMAFESSELTGFDELFDYIENNLLVLLSAKEGRKPLKGELAGRFGPVRLNCFVGVSDSFREKCEQEKKIRRQNAFEETSRILKEFGEARPYHEADYDYLLGALWEKRGQGVVVDWKSFIRDRRLQEGIDDSVSYSQLGKFARFEREKQEAWEGKQKRDRPLKIEWLQELKEGLFRGEFERRGFRFLHPGRISPKEIFHSIGYCAHGFPEPEISRLEVIDRDLKNAIPIYVGHTEPFPGYVLYRFNDSPIIMAEKPFYGNATYLLNCEWKDVPEILRRSKTDVLSKHRHEATRVIHENPFTWISQIKRLLKHGWH